MIEKLRTLLWFAGRPSHWPHAFELFKRKFRADYDTAESVVEATKWASEHAISVANALVLMGFSGDNEIPRIPLSLLEESEALAKTSSVTMGGPGDLELLHAAVSLSGALRIVETGVAYGWSSLAILSAIKDRKEARLASVDMPYPKAGNEPYVGIVVPENLRAAWTIFREPDRRGLEKAIAQLGGVIDLCHYDSDKSWWGRQYAFPILWQALVPGGVFICDDIQDNMGFATFVKEHSIPFAVTASSGKYVGIARKP
jgi:predicted O-methyltransferase YrrM